ncbi:MAG: hypothetical protein JSW50_12345 [Candidatus Latescibacterota bacterium]|nr:MAG: hypothetical protein JSW50_12345 [Candidatus Latescibacterota bacterium]
MAGRFITILLLVVFAAVCIGDARMPGAIAQEGTQTTAVDDAYKQAMEKRRAAEPIEDRLAITKAFLDQYPESKYTARSIGAVVYYYGRLDDMPGAVAYTEALRAKISDATIARDVDKEMIVMYGEAGMTDKMIALADGLAAEDALDFGDYWSIIEIGIDSENWKLARDYCGRAEPLANAEAFRANYPDEDFTDEEIEKAGDNRKGMLLVKGGWARANQGEIDEALADFAQADGLVRRSYLDVPEYNLNLYWGKTLMMKGDFRNAGKRFAADALVMGNDDAHDGLRKAYIEVNGGEDGFKAYAVNLHKSIAKPMQSFELPDYNGKRHRYDNLKGNVTLVAFWFPT